MVMKERHPRISINWSRGHRWRCQMTGIMLSFLLLVVVEAAVPRRRDDNYLRSQALKEEEDRLKAEVTRLEQEIAQVQEVRTSNNCIIQLKYIPQNGFLPDN